MKTKPKYRTDLVNTVIGEDCAIKGTIHSQRSIRIEGTFEGDINSQGEIFVSETAKVNATLFAKHIIIAGEVIGNIEAVKSLQILKSGKVFGDISGDQLHIEEGGVYKGKVNMDIISSKNAYEGEFQLKKA